MTDNYYERENGLWYVKYPNGKKLVEYSGSMEIAYQMGIQKSIEDMNLKEQSLADLLLTHRKAGMKEVVDWLDRCKKIKVPKYQMKEWGI